MAEGEWVAGLHGVRAALLHGADAVVGVWYDSGRRDRRLHDLLTLARQARVPLHPVERAELDRLSRGANHQGAAAQVLIPAALDESALERLLDGLTGPPLLLVLDGVQDPHNLGACLRAADGAGAQAVVAPRDRSVGLTPTVCKVASGAAGQVPYVQVTNLSRCLERLRERGVWVVGCAGEAAASLYAVDLAGPLALVLGGEANGLRRLTREHCDELVSLPMRGHVESLNVAVTAGVVLYEALRQRGRAT